MFNVRPWTDLGELLGCELLGCLPEPSMEELD